MIDAGTRLGPYEVLAPLGAGGMGEVWRARDTRLHREVAIKFLPEALARDPDHITRFKREARSLAALNHSNIAAIYGIEEAGGSSFLVLELVEGETLAERLAGGALPLEEALSVCRQIAEALEAAHGKGIVHRDLKPANVKLTPEGKVKVLDFGLAKSLAKGDPTLSRSATTLAGQTREGMVLGTPFYMSPEQARGKPVDKRADLWSFGCVMYETLTGRRAFEADTASDALAAILSREPDWEKLPGETPSPVRQLLRRCLEKDSARRQRDAGDAGLELDAVLAARSPSPTPRAASSGAPPQRASLLRTLSSLLQPRRASAESPAPFSPARLSQVTFAEAIEQFPAFSPDGERLAFCRETGKVRKIVVKDLRSGDETPLTRGQADDIQPDWSADGQSVVFARGREPDRKLEPVDVFGAYEGADLWSVEIATGKESRLIENAANPSFSPNGR